MGRASEIIPIHVGMSSGSVILQVLLKQPYHWSFMDAASLSYIEETILRQASWSWV